MPELDYIECAGVRVPSNWKIKQLASALEKRKIRFNNEQEIMNVFGHAIHLQAELEARDHELRKEIQKLESEVKLLDLKLLCPHCKKRIDSAPAIIK